MKKILFLAICCFSFFSFSQEKQTNEADLKLKLLSIQNNILKTESKLNAIQSRKSDLSNTKSDLDLQSKINELNAEKARLKKIEFSIQAALSQTSSNSDVNLEQEKVIISKSEFEEYPKENQLQILAHPERYVVESTNTQEK